MNVERSGERKARTHRPLRDAPYSREPRIWLSKQELRAIAESHFKTGTAQITKVKPKRR